MNNEDIIIGCIATGECDIIQQLTDADMQSAMGRLVLEKSKEIIAKGESVDIVALGNSGVNFEKLHPYIDKLTSVSHRFSAINGLKRERAKKEALAFDIKKYSAEELPIKFVEKAQALRELLHFDSEALCDFAHELKSDVPTLHTGFKNLDALLGSGIELGGVFVVGGVPGDGKTAFACHMASKCLERDLSVHFVTLEMSRPALARRIMQSYWQKTLDEIKNNIDNAMQMSGRLTVSSTLTRLPDVMGSMYRHTDADIIFVDYVQRIKNPDFHDNRVGEIESVSGAIANFARETGIPVVLLAQLNRDYKNARSEEPQMYHLKGSQALEADAHIIGLLHNPNAKMESLTTGGFNSEAPKKPDFDERTLFIRKNRNGPVGELSFQFDKPKSSFIPLSL